MSGAGGVLNPAIPMHHPPPMWNRRDEGRVAVLALGGRVHESADIDRAMAELCQTVAAGPTRRWVVDLSGLALVTSSGIAQLIEAARKIGLGGGRLVLARPTPPVQAVWRSARLEKLLPLHADTVAAVTALAG